MIYLREHPMTEDQLIEAIRSDGLEAKQIGVPRVSSILDRFKPLHLFRNPAVQERGRIAMERGTRIHKHIETMIDAGFPFPVPSVEEDALGYMVSFRDWWRQFYRLHKDYRFYTEVPLGSKDWPLRGTADLIAVKQYQVRDEKKQRLDFCLYDWKTGKALYESYPYQIAAYKMMLHKSLQKRGIRDYTIDAQVILLDREAGPVKSVSCHQTDVSAVEDCVLEWVSNYEKDAEFKRKHDAGVQRALESQT